VGHVLNLAAHSGLKVLGMESQTNMVHDDKEKTAFDLNGGTESMLVEDSEFEFSEDDDVASDPDFNIGNELFDNEYETDTRLVQSIVQQIRIVSKTVRSSPEKRAQFRNMVNITSEVVDSSSRPSNQAGPKTRRVGKTISNDVLPCPPTKPNFDCLLLDVKTRWNSVLNMLQRAYCLRKAFDMYVPTDPKTSSCGLGISTGWAGWKVPTDPTG
jgi:hypothetical protein